MALECWDVETLKLRLQLQQNKKHTNSVKEETNSNGNSKKDLSSNG